MARYDPRNGSAFIEFNLLRERDTQKYIFLNVICIRKSKKEQQAGCDLGWRFQKSPSEDKTFTHRCFR